MSEKPTIAHGDEYVVIFEGGPSDGRTERRISTDGSWDETLNVLASESGNEALVNYDASDWREVGGTYHVTYVYDPQDSEEFDEPRDRD